MSIRSVTSVTVALFFLVTLYRFVVYQGLILHGLGLPVPKKRYLLAFLEHLQGCVSENEMLRLFIRYSIEESESFSHNVSNDREVCLFSGFFWLGLKRGPEVFASPIPCK